MQFEERIKINAPAERIFLIYENVSDWSNWDPDVKTSSIDGDFKTGVTGKLKPTNGPEAKITFSEVVPNKSFTVESRLPFCIMTFEHELIERNSKTEVMHRVNFSGFLSPIFGRIIGKSVRKGLPATLSGLKNKAETKS